MLKTDRERLGHVEAQIRDLREERRRATQVKTAALKAAEKVGAGDDAFTVAELATQTLREVEAKLEQVGEEQTGLLRNLGDVESGRIGLMLPGENGYALAASGLDLAAGKLRVDVPASSLLRAQAVPLPPSPSGEGFALATVEQSRRYLYPIMPRSDFGDGSGRELAATDFTVSFAQDELTGMERAPDATTGKATLAATTSLATVAARQHAVVANGVPSKLFDQQEALRSFLGTELARRVDESIDAHVAGKIEAANPPSGSTGATLIPKIRNAIAAMRELGGNPTYLAVTPQEAAGLDLSLQPGTGDYIFRIDLEGSGGLVWSLIVRESPTITAPTLISPELGVLYVGGGSVLVDPYSGMTTNQVRARVELEATFHVRNAGQGAYRIV